MKNRLPPKLLENILSSIIRPDNRYTLLGDIGEEYSELAQEKGDFFAGLWYLYQIIIPLSFFIRSYINWSIIMFRNYFKSMYRGLIKNKLFGFISLFSLSTAIGCSMSIFILINIAYDLDAFHENKESIFLIKSRIDRNGEVENWGISPSAIGPALKSDFPIVEHYVRAKQGSGTVKYKNSVFSEGFLFVDKEFLNIFTFKLKSGDIDVLKDKRTIVLTSEMAEKYFGEEDPVGKEIVVKIQNNAAQAFIVGGILESLPVTSGIRFNFLIPYPNFPGYSNNATDWKFKVDATFIKVKDLQNIQSLTEGLINYIPIQNTSDPDWLVEKFFLEGLPDVSNNSTNTRSSLAMGPGTAAVIAFSTIGVLILLLACLNYLNIALAGNTARLKEIAVRKSIGSTRFEIFKQFIGENVFLNIFALILGAFMAQYIFLPVLDMLSGTGGVISIFLSRDIWGILLITVMVTALLSGAYPAIVISKFNPVEIFKNKVTFGSKKPFTKILLAVQFMITFILLTLSVLVKQNSDYQRTIDWGYDSNSLIAVPIDGSRYYNILQSELISNSMIRDIAGSTQHVSQSYNLEIADYQGSKYECVDFSVGQNYLDILKIRLKSGKFFENISNKNGNRSIIVNRTFVEKMQWDNALGKSVRINDELCDIIGVTEDFHYYSFYTKIIPVVFSLTTEENFRYILFQTKGSIAESAGVIEDAWRKLMPDEPFEPIYQDEVFDNHFASEEKMSLLFGFYGMIALMISCMGLFGLVSINIAKRTKEIALRKVLGADVFNIVRMINLPMLILLTISLIAAVPLSIALVNPAIAAIHEYYIGLSVGHLLFTAGIILLAAILTISGHIFKISKSNPSDSLRYE